MQKRFPSFLKKTLSAMLGLSLVALASFSAYPPEAAAQSTSNWNVHGYAWSDTIGWVSFNCAEGSPSGGTVCPGSSYAGTKIDYGVNIDPTTGAFSGTAWSDNVGWISFGASSCGSAGVLNFSTGAVTGWAKALAADASWDGCISLSGTTPANPSATPPIPAGTYGLTYSSTTTASIGSTTLPGHKLSGFVWDGTVIGWLDFTNVSFDPAAVSNNISISAAPSTVATGGATTITWTTNGVAANSCLGTMGPGSPTTNWTSGGRPIGYKDSTDSPPAHSQVIYNLSTPGTYVFMLHGCKNATTSAVIPDVSATVIVMNPTCAVIASNGNPTALAMDAGNLGKTPNNQRQFGVQWTPSNPGQSTTVTVAPNPPASSFPSWLTTAVSGSPFTNNGPATVSLSGTPPASFDSTANPIEVQVNAATSMVSCTPGLLYLNPTGYCLSHPTAPACRTGSGSTKRPPWIEQ